ncbi:hypothetical protein AT959_18915 [Dechloromonas denitrificans]|uniref:ABC-type transport auxiliary lipoprotein component domain-containing protein n=1 Tax=Dechloromonas denitrificans TaxID=281362 RepID=A0A133XD91_9RHOO|nr:ABC-type transport auxiliary lipoprotein family protein [Dechloromonas denitrificans]KXB28903.1 hypothetical protein AT959_18915 [Dechloromonas denitrificans]
MRRFAIIFLSFALSACFTAGKRGGDTAMAVYDLGPGLERQIDRRQRPSPMAVEVRAPLWFDALGINYRLAYSDPARLREYARARWAGPPAQMIQLGLVRDLGLVAAGQGRSNCVVRLEIDEFSQVFETPVQSRAQIQGRVQWLDKSRARLAERTIHLEQAAASADAQGGVKALTALVGQLTAAINDWEQESVAAGQLRNCQL